MEVHSRLRCCPCQVTGLPYLEDAAHGLYVRVHYPGFVFVPGADVFGHDEPPRYQGLENNVPALIKQFEELRQSKTVSGFNTLGYFKNSFEVNTPLDRLLVSCPASNVHSKMFVMPPGASQCNEQIPGHA